jgi:hypothetical protein
MFHLAFLAAAIVCTSQVVPSADPHGTEYVTQIEISSDRVKAQSRTYKYDAWELWGLENVESLLTDDHLVAPVRYFEVEEVSSSDRRDELRSYELYSTDGWQWTLNSVLTVNGSSSERFVNVDGSTLVQKMNCK